MPGSPRPAPEALTTDAWYTLYYVSAPEHRALASRRRRLWSEPLVAGGVGRARALALLRRRDRWTRDEELAGRTPPVRVQVARLARWSGVRLDADDLADRLDRTLLQAVVRAAPGAREAVRALDRDGVPLGVVSNVLNESGHVARSLLERLGLLSHFRTVVLSCEHPWAKPAPQPFGLACRFLGVAPSRAAHVGDLAYDLRGSASAGMTAWWYDGLRRWNRYLPGQVDPRRVPAERLIRSWDEIPSRFR